MTVNRTSDFGAAVTHGVYHSGQLVGIVSGGPEYAQDVIAARARRQGIPPDDYTIARVRVHELQVKEQPERTFSVTVRATSPQEARAIIHRDINDLTLTEGAPK